VKASVDLKTAFNYLIFQAVFTNCLTKKDYVGRERARGEQGQ
jgi:hypothetical protein